MLFLAKYHKPATYSDGAIYLGIIEAFSSEEAELQVANILIPYERADGGDYEDPNIYYEDLITEEEIAAYKQRKQLWIIKEQERLNSVRKEEIQKTLKHISVSPVGSMLFIQLIPTTY